MSEGDAVLSTGEAPMALVHREVETVRAIVDHLLPGTENMPKASEVGVVEYIDRALAGFARHLQAVYRVGLKTLDRICQKQLSKRSFLELTAEEQVMLIRRYYGPEVGGLTPPTSGEEEAVVRLFQVIRDHAIEGYFCDPIYGGNRGAVAWRAIGFPGAHWSYTPEEVESNIDARTIPIVTLTDLARQLNVANL